MGIYSPKTVPTLCSRYILIGIIMEDEGKVSEAKTHKLNAMYVYHSIRQPGYVYEFCALKKDKYRCVRCHRVGKSRYVTIRNAAVVPSTKHPEDDHVQLPSYHEVRSQLTRHRTHSCILVPDPLAIPDILKKTLRAREAAEDDPMRDERFLLHSGQGGT